MHRSTFVLGNVRPDSTKGSIGFPFSSECPNQRRGSKAVMQRIANPSRWVRLPPAPPAYFDSFDFRTARSRGLFCFCAGRMTPCAAVAPPLSAADVRRYGGLRWESGRSCPGCQAGARAAIAVGRARCCIAHGSMSGDHRCQHRRRTAGSAQGDRHRPTTALRLPCRAAPVAKLVDAADLKID